MTTTSVRVVDAEAETAPIAVPETDTGTGTPLELYAEGLADVTAGADGISDGPWLLRYDDGAAAPLQLHRWCSDAMSGDSGLVHRCTGATLDVGCGPGRLAAAVGARGLPVLGLDISPAAVRIARRRGALVLQRSVFNRVPGEGRWKHVLLADGNVGIGGDPAALLRRCGQLAAPDGVVLTEVDPPGTRTRTCEVRIESASGRRSETFPWAHVGADRVESVANRAGLHLTELWMEADRWFAALVRR